MSAARRWRLSSPRDSAHEDRRFRALRLLEANPELTQRDLAETLGLSLGSANYCLRALIDAGLVKVRNFNASKRKLSYIYVLTPKGLAAKTRMTQAFLVRKRAEYEALKAEIAALELQTRTDQIRTRSANKKRRSS